MKHKRLFRALGGAALLILLLMGLVLAARGAENASITSFGAALWFGLTTLTTVGYGDTFPVTTLGRIIGVIFQLCSLGLLALAVGAFLALVRGRLMPRLKLWLGRDRSWYAFSHNTPAARTLAAALLAREPGAQIVYAAGAEPGADGLYPELSLAQLGAKKAGRGGLSFFCVGPSGSENEVLARSLAPLGFPVCCMSRHDPDLAPDNLTFFDPDTCCARLYWQRHPPQSPTERMVIVGDGSSLAAILEEGLCRNILDPDQQIQYIVIGDTAAFCRNHPDLALVCDPALGFSDRLTILDGPWNQDLSLLAGADRLIFCGEDETITREQLTDLFRYCPVRGVVHARLSSPWPGVEVFGAPEELFTPELVLHGQLDRLARRLHEIYRAKSGGEVPPWSELSGFTRRSNLASADHLPVKLALLLGREAEITPQACREAWEIFSRTQGEARDRLRRIEHLRWTRFHLLNNWHYAPVRDNARRLHPMLARFEDLSQADQAKDDYAWDLLQTLTQEGESDHV